ncbi:hypothetical protein L6Q79_02370 [bacterium]|nr:hypothetical protein [bacterium]NUN45088.1 hypothetical protein [bacterium]
MKTLSIRYLILLVSVFWITGCPSKDETAIEKAQQLFEDGDYEEALSRYESLIATEGSTARVGAGWSAMRLNDLNTANVYFSEAALDSIPDGYAGWSVTLWGSGSLLQSLDKTAFVLRKKPEFKLSLDRSVTHKDLIWVQASCYYQLGNYPGAVNRIQALDDTFAPNMEAANLAEVIALKLQALGTAH